MSDGPYPGDAALSRWAPSAGVIPLTFVDGTDGDGE